MDLYSALDIGIRIGANYTLQGAGDVVIINSAYGRSKRIENKSFTVFALLSSFLFVSSRAQDDRGGMCGGDGCRSL